MPHLKQKILNARKCAARVPEDTSDTSDRETSYQTPSIASSPLISVAPKPTKKASVEKPKPQRQPKLPKKSGVKKPRDKSQPSSKNIVKNYGKIMCSFAASELSLPYLAQIYEKEPFDIKKFQNHMREKRDDIDSIGSVRSLLLVRKEDTEEIIRFKKVFQETSIIFIKYFSVNWVFQGKMSHKLAHLRSRFKMIRRIKNPECFTYFKEFRSQITH